MWHLLTYKSTAHHQRRILLYDRFLIFLGVDYDAFFALGNAAQLRIPSDFKMKELPCRCDMLFGAIGLSAGIRFAM